MSALVTARSSRTACLRLDTGHCVRRSRLALLHGCNLSPHSHPQTVSNLVGYAHCTVMSAILRNPPFACLAPVAHSSDIRTVRQHAATACHNALGAGIMRG